MIPASNNLSKTREILSIIKELVPRLPDNYQDDLLMYILALLTKLEKEISK